MIEAWLAKADRALASARLLIDNGDYEGAVDRIYYAVFDAAKAALLKVSPEIVNDIKTHTGIISAFSQHLIQSGLIDRQYGRFFNGSHELRLKADYHGLNFIDQPTVEAIWPRALEFIDEVKRVVMLDPQIGSKDSHP